MKFTTTLFSVSQTWKVSNIILITTLKGGLGGQLGQPRVNHDLETFFAKTFNMNFVQNDVLNMIKVFWKTMYTCMHWSSTRITQIKPHKYFNHTWGT